MFVLITVDALYYNAALRTFNSHADAFRAGCLLGSWFDIERIY
jgi:hypothetical protein